MDNPYSVMAEIAEDDVPYIIVYNPELTYSAIHRRQMETKIEKQNIAQKNKPTYTTIQRLLVDIVGPIIIYAGTFIVCDMLNTISTGNWTSLTRMFTGLWDYRHNVLTDFRQFILNTLQELAGNTVDCDKKRNYGYDYCETKFNSLGDDILNLFFPFKPDTEDVAACKAKVDENYDDCYSHSTEGKCTDNTTGYYDQCIADTSGRSAPPPPPGVIGSTSYDEEYWQGYCNEATMTGYNNCMYGLNGYGPDDPWPQPWN